MGNIQESFIQDIKAFLKSHNNENDPFYWKSKNNVEVTNEAIQQVFNAKFCNNCDKWKYKESYRIYKDGRSSKYCATCEIEEQRRKTYSNTRMTVYKQLQNDKSYRVSNNVLKKYNIEYDDYLNSYVLM